MKAGKISFVLVFLEIFASKATAKGILCESITSYLWDYGGVQKTCYMRPRTTIDSHGFTISSTRDETVLGLLFHFNKKVSFLPVNVSDKFPNLLSLSASSCKLSSITKESFRDLNNLKALWLDRNRIEHLPIDVFSDLTSLELLSLTDNDIKSIDRKMFLPLIMLQRINLKDNECIDENFKSHATLSRAVSENCGFKEDFSKEPSQVIKMLETLISETVKENGNLRLMVERKTLESATFEAAKNEADYKYKAAKDAQIAAENQIVFMKEMYEKLEVQRNNTSVICCTGEIQKPFDF